MGIKAVFAFMVGLGVIGVIAGIALVSINTARGRKVQPGILLAVASLVAVLILSPLNVGLVVVQPNQVGVVFRQTASGDAALLTPLTAGLKWVVPFVDDVTLYNIDQQSVTMTGITADDQNGAVRAVSKDGQEIQIDVTVIYAVSPAEVNRIHRNWPNNSYANGFVIPQARSEVRNVVSQYGAEQIYGGGRAQLEAQIYDNLAPTFEREGLILSSILIRDTVFGADFANAIEQKQIAEQEAQRAVFLVEQARQAAEQARVAAQGQADAAVIAAQGEADSIIIRAQAESEGLTKINEVLSQNPNLLQWQYINTLGDNIEILVIPSNSPFLFNMDQLLSGSSTLPTTTTPSITPSPETSTP